MCSERFDGDSTLEAPVRSRSGRFYVEHWAGRTTVGLRRADNQDCWGHGDDRLFVASDGIGSIPGGGLASRAAVAELLRIDPSPGWVPAIRELNGRVAASCRSAGFDGAGATLVALLLERRRAIVVNVGDSRLYRIRHGLLEQLTTDQTLAALRLAEGREPEGLDPRGNPSALASYVGVSTESLQVEIGTATLAQSDRFLLCTDGVHDQLSGNLIRQILGAGSAVVAAEALVEAADSAGGRDNATAIVVDVSEAR